MRRMILDSDVTPIEIVGKDDDWWCDFCGEKRICVAGVRREAATSGATTITLAKAGICMNCAGQALRFLTPYENLLPDGQMERP